jgi:hypothetical protein
MSSPEILVLAHLRGHLAVEYRAHISPRRSCRGATKGGHSRLLAAVRSIRAGILLLYKEALRRASRAVSNEALLKVKILPRRTEAGTVEFVGDGQKTVDVQQIRER